MLLSDMLLLWCPWEQMQVRNYENKIQLPMKRDKNSTNNIKRSIYEKQKPHEPFLLPIKRKKCSVQAM